MLDKVRLLVARAFGIKSANTDLVKENLKLKERIKVLETEHAEAEKILDDALLRFDQL